MADPTDDVDPPDADDDANDLADEAEDDQPPEGDDDLADDTGDDGEQAAADDDGGTGDDEPPARQQPRDSERPREGRGNRQFGQLRSENRELKRRLEEVERRTVQPQPGYDPGAEQRRRQAEEAAAEEQVLLSGDPAQIARFYSERSTREVKQQLGQLAHQSADSNDRAAFEREADRNPLIGRLRDKVESELANARRNGHNPTRAAIARYLLGEQMLKRAPAALTKQQRRADGDRQRQRGRPINARGDTGGGAQGNSSRRDGGNSQAARAKRLDESGLL